MQLGRNLLFQTCVFLSLKRINSQLENQNGKETDFPRMNQIQIDIWSISELMSISSALKPFELEKFWRTGQ